MSRALRPTLQQARARYVYRFTMEHVPQWARAQRPDGTFYAPQYRTDAEWFANTLFKGDPGWFGIGNDCQSSNQSWPIGKSLPAVFTRGQA